MLQGKFKFFVVLVFAMLQYPLFATDAVKLTASGPGTVFMGRPFQIKYTANARVTDFRAPAITNFDILAGPFKSESYSSQIINGVMSSSVSISYTYTLQAQRPGTFSIPSATVFVNDEKFTSTGLNIKVMPADEGSGAEGNQQQQRQQSSSTSSAANNISSQNLFIRPILSRQSVYEQEAVKLTYKLYTTYDVVQFSNKEMPDFNGFLKQETERTGNTQLAYESYKGKNFLTAVLYEIILYPQSAGELTIDKAAFEAIIRVQSRQPVRSIFDDFFETYSNVPRVVDVPAVKIQVKKLPAGKPDTFTGVVGDFSITSSVSAGQVKVNEAVTIKVNISGSGNMKLIKNPEFDFPEAFEVYDPKVTNNFKTSANGLTGNKTVEVMFIPRHSGKYEIPATETTYFNPADGSYRTLRTPVFTIDVLKADGTPGDETVVNNFSGKEDVKQLGNDIRYIFAGETKLQSVESYVSDKFIFWLLFFILPFIAALALYVGLGRYVQYNSDKDLVKNRKANKVAVKRLRHAQKLLQQGKKEEFYAEIMNAFWSYLSDKLLIPVAELSKDKVKDVLLSKQVPEDEIRKITEVLNICEFARFAPPTGEEHMGNLYGESLSLIGILEGYIKK
jgi:hypothetical protein